MVPNRPNDVEFVSIRDILRQFMQAFPRNVRSWSHDGGGWTNNTTAGEKRRTENRRKENERQILKLFLLILLLQK
jgi:hypothetical protein